MPVKPIEVKKVAPIAAKVEPVKSQSEKDIEAVQRKVLSDTLNSEKGKRDVQVRTVDDLETRIRMLMAECERLVLDHNLKVKINDNLGASIQAAHIDLANLKSKFGENNAKLVAEYDKKLKEVQLADGQLQTLVKENREKEQSLARERGMFNSERESIRQRLIDMENALSQNNAQWKVREADILAREEALKTEKTEFEAYRDSLAPEIARITSIKNENVLLIQRLEQENRNVENMRLAAAAERAQAEEARLQVEDKSNQDRMKVANEEARLRKWEQDIKDQALELRAQEAEYNRVLRREKLEADLKKGA